MILAGCLGFLGWLAVAFGLATLVGRAIRLADRRATARNRAVAPPDRGTRHDTRDAFPRRGDYPCINTP